MLRVISNSNKFIYKKIKFNNLINYKIAKFSINSINLKRFVSNDNSMNFIIYLDIANKENPISDLKIDYILTEQEKKEKAHQDLDDYVYNVFYIIN